MLIEWCSYRSTCHLLQSQQSRCCLAVVVMIDNDRDDDDGDDGYLDDVRQLLLGKTRHWHTENMRLRCYLHQPLMYQLTVDLDLKH